MASAFEMMRNALKTLQTVDFSDMEPSKAAALQSVRDDLEAAALKLDNLCAPRPPPLMPLPLMPPPLPPAPAPAPAPAPKPKAAVPKQVRFEPECPKLKAIAAASRAQVFAELELMGWPDYMLTEFNSLWRYSYSDEYLRAGLSWFVESTGLFPSEVPAEKKDLVDYGAYFRILDRLTKEQFVKDFRCAYRDCYTEEDLMCKDFGWLRVFAKDWMVVHMRLPLVYKDLPTE